MGSTLHSDPDCDRMIALRSSQKHRFGDRPTRALSDNIPTTRVEEKETSMVTLSF
ncbi:hypothetical protein H6G27_23315 [Nostoc linckia FACHB-104]|nr:hypothetical protein [Nostoc linckia FACHB-104]